jgi:hypothetical protein
MIEIKYNDETHRYWLKSPETEGLIAVPSVTEILDEMSNAPALPWWGMRVGMAGVVEMMADVPWGTIANANTPLEIIDPASIQQGRRHFTKADRRQEKPRSLVETWVVDHKRSTNHLADLAGDRGTSIHTVLEMLALDEMPDPSQFPEDHRGWVAGLIQWYLDQEPVFLMNEVMVGSVEHRFAGRFDAIVRYPDADVALLDLKTSKGVYKKHLRQLALYEVGFREMGLWDTLRPAAMKFHDEYFDRLEVLHVRPDGGYSMVPSKFRPEHVIPTVAAFHADRAGWLLHQGVPGLHEDVR